MVNVTLLAAMGEWEAGDVIEVDQDTADKLVTAGLAELAEGDEPKGEEAPKDAETEKAINAIASRIDKALDAKFAKIESKAVKTPAKVIDQLCGFKKIGDWLKCMAHAHKGDHTAQAKMQEFSRMQKASVSGGQSETYNSGHDGGDTVPEIWANELWDKVRSEYLLSDHVTKYEASGGILHIPRIVSTSRATGSRPLRYYPVAEGNPFTLSKMTTDKLTLTPHKYGVLASATSELIDDSNSNWDQVVTDQLGKELRFCINDLMVNGAGGGTAPTGLLNQNCKVTVTKVSGQPTATIYNANLAAMIARLPYGSQSRAVFLYNRAAIGSLMTLAFDPAATSKSSAWGLTYNAADEYPMRYQGIPFQELETLPAFSNSGSIILVDLSTVALFMKKPGIQIDISKDLYFASDEIAYRAKVRFDCDNLWAAAETQFSGSATQSPVVVMESIGT